METEYRLGFIGAGNMAQAILYGITDAALQNGRDIYVSNPSKDKRDKVCARAAANAADINIEAVQKSDLIFLCVKPHLCEVVLEEIQPHLSGKALLSVVSGWSFADFQKHVPSDCRILTIQPNTALQVKKGISLFCREHSLREQELAYVTTLFEALGIVILLPDSLMMVGSTAGGASLAMLFMVLEAMADGSVEAGLPRETAYMLGAQAMVGAGSLYMESGLHPSALKDQVTSPKGSTILGIHALENAGVRGAFMDAMRDCNARWAK